MTFLKKISILSLCLCSAMIFLNACGSDDEAPDPDCGDPSYSADIVPILESTCALSSCHVTDFDFGDYNEYDDVKAQADNGSLVSEISSKNMPPSNTTGPSELTDAEIALIECWVEKGALNN